MQNEIRKSPSHCNSTRKVFSFGVNRHFLFAFPVSAVYTREPFPEHNFPPGWSHPPSIPNLLRTDQAEGWIVRKSLAVIDILISASRL